jgi:hypothetical protein
MKYNFLLGRLRTVATPWWQHQQRHQRLKQENILKWIVEKKQLFFIKYPPKVLKHGWFLARLTLRLTG